MDQDGKTKGLANLRPAWEPGQSGNPTGRKPVPNEIRDLLELNLPEAFQTVLKIMMDPKASHRDRLRAAELWIERAMGKAVQPVVAFGQPGSAPDLDEVAKALLLAGIKFIDVEDEDQPALPPARSN